MGEGYPWIYSLKLLEKYIFSSFISKPPYE